MELIKFLEDVSKDTPTPGGGSVIALVGALSASLISMVAGVSMRRSQIKEEKLKKIIRESKYIQKRLYLAIDEDAKSFDAVIEAYRLSKESKEELMRRNKAIEKAYKNATLIPRLVCEKSIKLMEFSKILINGGNQNAISDVGVAALLADSAFKGGLLNINVNLRSIKEKNFLRKMKFLLKQSEKKRDMLMNEIIRSLWKIKTLK